MGKKLETRHIGKVNYFIYCYYLSNSVKKIQQVVSLARALFN